MRASIALRSNSSEALAGRVARVEATSDSVTEERAAMVAFDAPPAGVHDEKIIPTFKRIYRIRDGRTYEEAGQGQSA